MSDVINVTITEPEPIIVILSPVGVQGLPGVGIPAGGTTGQFLVKKTNADYDVEWITYP